jgi:ATP-dependent RNA helicase RhlE
MDRQKRLDDPDFKGAFHEKKTLQAKLKFKQERDKKQRRSR